ncbi:MAG: hypothetical protein DHS20C01_19530 [marine bacterium B5-7]|nr:MAG: hypothetical protein DHS20C01_19530 [marine bacterium B5-7]
MNAPIVDVENIRYLTKQEHCALSARIDVANMTLYRTPDMTIDHQAVLTLGEQFGLRNVEHNICADDDGVSDVTVKNGDRHGRYIPYTSRQLSWHTDGYYNADDRAIKSFILHCSEQGIHGGENELLDHEILFGLLQHDNNIDHQSLFAHDAFAIPANMDGGEELRERYVGPVFNTVDNRLHMRFSARSRNIEWNTRPAILTAVEAIRYYLNHSPLTLKIRLEPGMGIITRNVLHRRSAFVDSHDQRRLVFRARYRDDIYDQQLSGFRDALAK